MNFASRKAAGTELGRCLIERGITPDIVLGLPRGGVVVAAEVAGALRCPLDVLVVRKIGHPRQREFAVGALAEPDVVLLDKAGTEQSGIFEDQLKKIIIEETVRLQNYLAKFHQNSPATLAGKTVLLVDDGLATGATTEAAVISARKQKARWIVVAAPVASPSAVERIKRVAEEVVALAGDRDFAAVGQYYDSFPQTTDEEVLALLHAHA